MFEAVHSERMAAEPAALWELWQDLSRWPQWNPQVERAGVEAGGETAAGGLELGTTLAVKLRRGGTVHYRVSEIDSGRLLRIETRFPGARLAHEHVAEPRPQGSEVVHRTELSGPLWPVFALLLGRKRMRSTVAELAARERELITAPPQRRSRGRRGRR